MKNLQGVGDKLIVEVLDKESVSDGGIVLPESVNIEPQFYGKVLSVGKEVEDIKVDDVIAFHERAGMDLTLNKKKIKCIKYEEIYGVIF